MIGGEALYREALPLARHALPHRDPSRFRRRCALSRLRSRARGAKRRAKRTRAGAPMASTSRLPFTSGLPTVIDANGDVDSATHSFIPGEQTMSEGFHVHGPHDHEVEHQAQHGDPFAGRIAVMTAIFATIGAMFGYMGGATQNAALLYKNEAAIRRTEASDQWNFYQAKSSKQNLAELGATLTTGEAQAKYSKEVERYKKEKEEIMPEAKKLEDAVQGRRAGERGVDARASSLGAGDHADPDRDRARRDHHPDAQQGTAIHVLWRRRAAVAIGALAFLHI